MAESFVFSVFVGDVFLEQVEPAAREVLTTLKRSNAWYEGSIRPAHGTDFPRLEISYHRGHGFVVQVYEDERSWSDFLAHDPVFSAPRVEIELGGQALERWSQQLFVSEQIAEEAIEWFLRFGREKPTFTWVRIDQFPREVVCDDATGRIEWERTRQHSNPRDA